MSTKTILIAEDDEVIFMYLQIILKSNNFNILHARNGLEAINLWQENKVDLILMDIKMPVMNGLDAIREIRKTDKEIPIIVQSAYTSDENKESAALLGSNDFITKPINKSELIEKITNAIIINSKIVCRKLP